MKLLLFKFEKPIYTIFQKKKKKKVIGPFGNPVAKSVFTTYNFFYKMHFLIFWVAKRVFWIHTGFPNKYDM